MLSLTLHSAFIAGQLVVSVIVFLARWIVEATSSTVGRFTLHDGNDGSQHFSLGVTYRFVNENEPWNHFEANSTKVRRTKHSRKGSKRFLPRYIARSPSLLDQ